MIGKMIGKKDELEGGKRAWMDGRIDSWKDSAMQDAAVRRADSQIPLVLERKVTGR